MSFKTELCVKVIGKQAFLDAVDAGDITLRGDFENMDVVMTRLMERVSTINKLVRDNYVSELGKVGL